MRGVVCAALLLTACAQAPLKQPPPDPLPADIRMRGYPSYEDMDAVFMAYKIAWVNQRTASEIIVGVVDHPTRDGIWTVLALASDHTGHLTIGKLDGIRPVSEARSLGFCDEMTERVSDLVAHAQTNATEAKVVTPGKTSIVLLPEYIVVTPQGILTSDDDRALADYAEAVLVTADACLAAERAAL